jgi:lipopolysaccharide export system protein LptA
LLIGNGNLAFAAETEANIVAEGFVKTDLTSNITIAEKNVKVTYNLGEVEADQIQYNHNSGIVEATGNVILTSKTGIVLKARKVIYDLNSTEAQASGGIQLTSQNGLRLTAAQLDYNANNGLVKASGEVKVDGIHGAYETETLEYNLNDGTGSSGAISMTLKANRDIKIKADSMTLKNGKYQFRRPRITRCQEVNPEYQYVAKEAIYDGRYMRLNSIILYIKGVPAFYLISLNLDMTNLFFPHIELNYDHDNGLSIQYEYSDHLSDNLRWNFTGLYRSKTYSTLIWGLRGSKDNLSNSVNLYYNTEGHNTDGMDYISNYGINDCVTYNYALFVATLDGAKDFSEANGSELGFTFTRKYFESPVGKLQFGILGRRVSKEDGAGTEYGGIYGGYRLDYNPHPYFTLSLLSLYSLEGEKDYRDFMSDFKLGFNWMYNSVIPLYKSYSLGLNGTYNSDEELWIHQIYQINYQTDCLNLRYGWDNASQSVVFGFNIRF